MSDLLDRIRREIDDRIAVLRPVAEEAARLQRASDALDESTSPVAQQPAPPTPQERRPRAKPAGRRRAARAAPGQTQLRVIAELRSGPGSTSTSVAKALGISANAAAATISRLVKQGRVQRLQSGGYAAADAAAGDAAATSMPPDPNAH